MAVDNGLDKIKAMREKDKSTTDNRQRQALFNRLHITLMQAPGIDREQTRLWLPAVEVMAAETREIAIRERFGDMVLARCRPALDQLRQEGL